MILKLIISLSLLIAAGASALAGNDIVLYNANIIDTDTGGILYGRTVTVEDGVIVKISPARKRIRKGETDASGRFLIPGMIDSHTHYGNQCGDPDKAAAISAEYLKQGVTTVRDVGGNYLKIKEYNRLRENGDLHGPDIYYSSIWATGDFMMPSYHSLGAGTEDTAWSRIFCVRDSTDEALEKAVLEAKEIGCTGFKLYIHYSKEDLARLIPVIKRHGMKVWAHSAQVTGATSLEVAGSGVDVMSHSYLIPKHFYPGKNLSDADKIYVGTVLDKMLENDVVLDCTLALSYGSGTLFAADVTEMAYRKGVRFVIGTDLPGCRFLDEVEMLSKECGISNLDLLRAATVTGAEIIGQKGRVGVIAEGAEADIIMLTENPLNDISALRNIEMTIADGNVAYIVTKQASEGSMTLYNANIIDTKAGKVRYGRTIRIEDGKIVGIRRSGKRMGAEDIDMSGKYIMPGMIDAHVHWGNLAQDSLMAARLSEDFLSAGVTTVRDLGSNYLNIRRHLNHIGKGDYPGPDVSYCALWATGSYFMDPMDTIGWESDRTPAWSRKIDVGSISDADIEKAVIEAKEIGCTGFKIYIHYSKDDLARMIPIMKKHGMKVWAHATQVSGATALEVAESGVDVVSHAYMLADDITSRDSLTTEEKEYVRKVCRSLRRNKVVLDITAHISMHEGEMQYCRDIIRIADRENVRIAVGTDFFGCAMYEEIGHLKSCGISNRDILRAATVTGAEIIGQKGRLGIIRKGAEADLVIMDTDPLEDIDAVRNIRYTIKSGRYAYCNQE